MSIRTFYDMWPQYNQRISRVIADMTAEQLAVCPEPDGWPVWATVGHTAGGRVYWLCSIIGEAGAEQTPFTDPNGIGWEDDLDTPRGPEELAHALDSTFAIVDRCLDRWDEDMMGDVIVREIAGHRQLHSRGSILQRLFSHDSYHAGELSQTLGMHGLTQIDLWAAE
ncbi:MAG: DinB family protein [Acidimicrobiia bacterium]